MNPEKIVAEIGQRARLASYSLARSTTQQKTAALDRMAASLEAAGAEILAANQADVAEATDLSKASLDRLRLNQERVSAIAASVRSVNQLPDPVGTVISEWTRPNGLLIRKVRVPIGVVGIIYESRPNVTSDAAVLCFRAGNAVILRGGSESLRTNLAIAQALRAGSAEAGFNPDVIQLIPFSDRAAVKFMAEMRDKIDLIIPRGGKSLIEAVAAQAKMPVIKHYDGVCHVYVDERADLAMAESIVLNAKVQRPGVCNAAETLLIHAAVAPDFLPRCANSLWQAGVEIRGDQATRDLLGERVLVASEEDWKTEYLDLILSVRIVANVREAIEHVERYGSHHTDAIVTGETSTAEIFLNEVDSSAVLWNASTRFNDGSEFGFGAEIGISTDRLHARGPMALEELTIYKYVIVGDGQVR